MRIDEYSTEGEGEIYFVGDLHGCYDQLMSQLDDLDFDFSKDRLFSVGDLVDRGPDSLKCLELISEPWFFPIKGNHEQILIDGLYIEDPRERLIARQLWNQCGGSWYENLPYEYKLRAKKLASEANELPNGIQVGDIGVVHAEAMLPDWELLKLDAGSYCREFGMWSRQRYSRKSTSLIKNIKAVVVGHTPTKSREAEVLGNHVYIDSGACFTGGQLIIKSYDQILEMVSEP